jgi:hypothetical protein
MAVGRKEVVCGQREAVGTGITKVSRKREDQDDILLVYIVGWMSSGLQMSKQTRSSRFHWLVHRLQISWCSNTPTYNSNSFLSAAE